MVSDESSCPYSSNLRHLADVDPYPEYRAAVRNGPVHWDDSLRGWVVLGYADCDAVLKDGDAFVMPWSRLEGGHAALGRYGIFNLEGDPHAQAHKDMLDFFNPRKNPVLQSTVQRLVAESFDRVRGDVEVDFTAQIARRVPGLMGLAFLGVPQDEDVLETVHHANTALQNYMQSFGDDPSALAALEASHRVLAQLWAPTIEDRRRQPQDDIISRLVEQSQTLSPWSDTEMMSQCLFLFGASFGNTANTISNAAYLLATDERCRHDLTARPEKIPVFVDEVLRVWGAVQFRIRIATRDTEIAGTRIAAGDRVIVLVGAANRDERQFADPDAVDLDRRGSRRHLTFGIGARYCVGAPLARLETEEVVRALVDGAHELSLSSAPLGDTTRDRPRFAGLNYRVWEPVTMRLHAATTSAAR